jgi:hypothetical protein
MSNFRVVSNRFTHQRNYLNSKGYFEYNRRGDEIVELGQSPAHPTRADSRLGARSGLGTTRRPGDPVAARQAIAQRRKRMR